jgi:hypothetical protein
VIIIVLINDLIIPNVIVDCYPHLPQAITNRLNSSCCGNVMKWIVIVSFGTYIHVRVHKLEDDRYQCNNKLVHHQLNLSITMDQTFLSPKMKELSGGSAKLYVTVEFETDDWES